MTRKQDWATRAKLLALILSALGVSRSVCSDEPRALHTINVRMKEVPCLAFSPDGKLLATCAWDPTIKFAEKTAIKLWDVSTGQVTATLKGHIARATCLAFSPDGKTLASGCEDEIISLKLWDVSTGKVTTTLAGHRGSVMALAFNQDGTTLISGSSDRTFKLWDMATYKNVVTRSSEGGWGVGSLSLSPDGRTLALASGYVRLFSMGGGRGRQLGSGYARSVAFSPDGKTVASISQKGLELWDVDTGKNLLTVGSLILTATSRVNSVVECIAFSPDGKFLAGGSSDKTIRFWDMATRQELEPLAGHASGVAAVLFSPNGKTLASGSRDGLIKIWDIGSVPEAKRTTDPETLANTDLLLHGHSGRINAVAFSPDNKTVASGSCDRSIKLWNSATGKIIATFEGASGWIDSLAFSSDGRILASAETWRDPTGTPANTERRGGPIRLWDVSTGRNTVTFDGPHDRSDSGFVAFSPAHNVLASVSATDHNSISLLDVASGKTTALAGHAKKVNAVAFSRDGRSLASTSDDGTIRLWDVAGGHHEITLERPPSDSTLPFGIAFHPSRRWLASSNSRVRIWNLETNKSRLAYNATPFEKVRHLEYSRDGKTLAAGAIGLWDVATGRKIDPYIQPIAFSPDGRTVASLENFSLPFAVKLWRLPRSQ
jgi:WD40 repeat protein